MALIHLAVVFVLGRLDENENYCLSIQLVIEVTADGGQSNLTQDLDLTDN